MTNTIATNLSINFNSKKVKYEIDFYILHIVLLVIILLLIATIICYHYAKNIYIYIYKKKCIDALTI